MPRNKSILTNTRTPSSVRVLVHRKTTFIYKAYIRSMLLQILVSTCTYGYRCAYL